jgi:hypothetical protein
MERTMREGMRDVGIDPSASTARASHLRFDGKGRSGNTRPDPDKNFGTLLQCPTLTWGSTS